MLGERMGAEDLAQETFVRAYQRLETFDADRPFGPWIRRVATNTCLNHIQAQKMESYALDEERDRFPAAEGNEPEAAMQAVEAASEVRQAILSLPPHYRVVIELRHYQEMSYSEIGEALGLPISDVKSHLYRARRRLAGLISDND
jgi:RNA polymerase sigma-70 factor (ECF subfamily)